MKYFILFLLAAGVLLAGYFLIPWPVDPYAVSDFTPIHASRSLTEADDERPLNSTITTAVSTDGMAFEPTDVWIADQAHTPDVVQDARGRLFLYYSGWIVGNELNRSAVAVSQDAGETWVYKYLTLTGSDAYSSPQSPDIVLLDDGTFRLYYTAHASDFVEGIHYAESQDGLNFTHAGVVFLPTGYTAENSTTFKIGDAWHMYALSKEGPQAVWHLTSDDGVTFSVYARTSFPMDDEVVVPGNGLMLDEKFHLFVSAPESGEIRSWSTKNGYDWYPDNGVRLSPERGHAFVKDPTLVELEDGRRLMFYVTDTTD
ncbi:exo-alpha-sialidase [Candidatus Uhrbacteria bacterium]|nr:exo-alpha-sialidase [Candidatus Uhrbacteria bacterium]